MPRLFSTDTVNRLRLYGNPAGGGRWPECDAGRKKTILRLHFEKCRVKPLQVCPCAWTVSTIGLPAIRTLEPVFVRIQSSACEFTRSKSAINM